MAAVKTGPISTYSTGSNPPTASITGTAGDLAVVFVWTENAAVAAPTKSTNVDTLVLQGTSTPARAAKFSTGVYTGRVLTSGTLTFRPDVTANYNGLVAFTISDVGLFVSTSTEAVAAASQASVSPSDPVAVNDLLMGVWTSYTNGSGTPVYTAPTGMTKSSDENPGTINYARVMVAVQAYTAAGAAPGTKTATISGTTSGYWASTMLQLHSPVAGAAVGSFFPFFGL